MRVRRYLITAVFAALAVPPSVPAQQCDLSHAQEPFHLVWPFTMETRQEHEPPPSGPTPNPAREITRFVGARDSQGRYLSRLIYADGSSASSVVDPVAGEETYWNSTSTQAKLLIYPMSVAGRRSCWQVPDSERHPISNGPVTAAPQASCAPTGQTQPSNCRDACDAQRRAKALPPVNNMGFARCGAGQPGPIQENLGIDVIQGEEVHGCRETTTLPDGKRFVTETWYDDHHFPLRGIEAKPDGNKYSREVIRLSWDEPDSSAFRPPKGYEVVRIKMDEVPCEAQGLGSH
jgi:hypothetical protein